MIENQKKIVRTNYKKIRSSIINRSEKEKVIIEKLKFFEPFAKADKVFVYAATGSEANMDSLIRFALSVGKTVALPVCLDKLGNMEFYSITSLNFIKNGLYSIREPETNKCNRVTPDGNSVCVVPAVCFDRNGNRLGYGKGYYDRFLQNFNGCTIGVNFEECVAENIPCSEHDKRVNYLITDKNIYKFTNEEENTYG